MKMQSLSSLFSHSPSFNSTYSSSSSSEKTKHIVVHQFHAENNNSTDRFLLRDAFIKDDTNQLVSNSNNQQQHYDDDDESEGEFEFAFAPVLSPVPADQIFYKGQIRPLYPHFIVHNNEAVSCMIPKAARLPLRKLFVEEREQDNSTSSCSSSQTDELEELCNKSSNSRRWKFRDFLQKSNSDGKNSFGFLKS